MPLQHCLILSSWSGSALVCRTFELSEINSARINSGYYLAILEETWKVCSYFSWEVLVFHFDYSCSLHREASRIALDAPSSLLAKSMRAGFMRQEMQNMAVLRKTQRVSSRSQKLQPSSANSWRDTDSFVA